MHWCPQSVINDCNDDDYGGDWDFAMGTSLSWGGRHWSASKVSFIDSGLYAEIWMEKTSWCSTKLPDTLVRFELVWPKLAPVDPINPNWPKLIASISHADCIQNTSRLHPDCIQMASRLHPDRTNSAKQKDVTDVWTMFAWRYALDYALILHLFSLSCVPKKSCVLCGISCPVGAMLPPPGFIQSEIA